MDYLLRFLDKKRDLGLLLLRVGVGSIFIVHGLNKLLAGSERWTSLGGSLSAIGLPAPGPAVFWGLTATLTEFLGGILLILGLFFRPTLLALIGTMVVATLWLIIGMQADFTRYSHPLTVGWVFISMLFLGPGRFSLDGDRSLTSPALADQE
jgi:putative oxidoreductase